MPFGIIRHIAAASHLGEAPLWLPTSGVFLWLDLHGRQVHRFDPQGGNDRVIASGFAENLACLVRLNDGFVLLVTATGFLRLDPASGDTTPLPAPLRPPAGTCFNDGKVAPDGSLWLGISDVDEGEPTGSLHRVSTAGVECIDRGFVVANGPAFSPDGRDAYFADTVSGNILHYALDAGGRPVGRTLFASVPADEGMPDGMTTDRDGLLYSAHWQGSCISVRDPGGAAVETIALPTGNVTSCAFGGEDGSLLLATSAARDEDDGPRSPHGDAFVLRGQSGGMPEPEFDPAWLGREGPPDP